MEGKELNEDMQSATATLRKSWNDYLIIDSDNYELKDTVLDSFLNKFFYLQKTKNFRTVPEFSDLTSVGNILSRQFLYDIHFVCSECSANSENREDVTSLVRYLLEGNGWKILWLIKLIGVDTLSCNKELANLLLSLFPLCSQFPTQKHNDCGGTTARTVEDQQCSNVESCFQLYVQNKPIKSVKLRESQGSARIRAAQKPHRTKTPSSAFQVTRVESTDSDCPPESYRTVNHEPSLHFKSNPVDFTYFTRAGAHSSDNESDYETDDVDEDELDAFYQEPITSLEFCENVINLLQVICQGDASFKNSLGVPVSASILPFAVNVLISIQHGKGYVQHWSAIDVYRAKQQLLHLIFTSAAALAHLPDGVFFLEQCSVMSCLLSIAQDIQIVTMNKSSEACGVSRDKMLHFGFTIVFGCLRLLCLLAEQRLLHHDYGSVSSVLALSAENQRVCAKSIAMYEACSLAEDKHTFRIQFQHLLYVFSQTLMSIKYNRVLYWHSHDCTKRHHKHCNLDQYSHHHHDVFGVWNSHSMHSKNSSCCISVMITTVMEVYASVSDPVYQMMILSFFKKVGLCCCISLRDVLQCVLGCLSRQSPPLRQAAVNFVETTVMEHLGGSASSASAVHMCIVCRRNHETTKNLLDLVQTTLADEGHLSLESMQSMLESRSSVWGAVALYCPMLHHPDTVLVHQVEKHILQMCNFGNSIVKSELFLRVIFPVLHEALQMEQLQESVCSSVDQLVTCCLGALCILLKEECLSMIFLDSGGLQILRCYLSIPTLRLVVLKALHILIIVEVRRTGIADESAAGNKAETEVVLGTLDGLPSVIVFEEILLQNNVDYDFDLYKLADGTNENWLPELNTKLEQDTDLWTTCRMLVNKCTPYKIYCQKRNAARTAYRTLMSLLKALTRQALLHSPQGVTEGSLSDSKHQQWKKLMKSAFSMVESLLTVCLVSQPFVLADNEQVIDNTGIVEEIRSRIPHLVEWPPDILKMLMDTLIRSATGQAMNTLLKLEQAYLKCLLPDCEEVDDQEMEPSEIGFFESSILLSENDGYDADDELLDSVQEPESGEPVALATPELLLQCPVISQLVVDFLVTLANDVKLEDLRTASESHLRLVSCVLNRLVKLCRENVKNCTTLYRQNILKVILKDCSHFFAQTKDTLAELQSNIMELFVLVAHQFINAAEVNLFLDLFKYDDPPWDCLLSALHRLISKITFQPSSILCFPTAAVQSTLDPRIVAVHPVQVSLNSSYKFDSVSLEKDSPSTYLPASLHTNHKRKTLSSPWASAALVLPVQESGFGLAQSFSLSMWLKIVSSNVPTTRRKSHSEDSCVSPDSLLNFEESWFGNFTGNYSTQQNMPDSERLTKDAIHLVSVAADSMLFEVWSLDQTEASVLRISSSSSNSYTVLSDAVVKKVVSANQWHHVAINYIGNIQDDGVISEVELIFDGQVGAKSQLMLPATFSKADANYLLVGHQQQIESNPFLSWQLGSIRLYRGAQMSRELNIRAVALGPDCCNLFSGLADSPDVHLPPKPVTNLLKSGLEPNILLLAKKTSLEMLKNSVVMLYTSKRPDVCIQYQGNVQPAAVPQRDFIHSAITRNSATKFSISLYQGPTALPVTQLSDIEVLPCRGLDVAICELGGVPVLLLLLARIVESCESEEAQAKAMQLLLSFSGSSSKHRGSFMAASGPALLQKLLFSPRLKATYLLLKEMMDACLSVSIINCEERGQRPKITPNSAAVIIDSELLSCMLSSWHAWEKDDVNVGKLLLSCVKTLIQDDHLHHEYNRQELAAHHVLETLLSSCKERFIHNEQLWIPAETCRHLIFIMRIMVGNPPDVDVLAAIFDFILLVHPLSNTCVCHSRTSFYFNLSSQNTRIPVAVELSTSSSVSKLENLSNSTGLSDPVLVGSEKENSSDLSLPVDANKLTKALANLKIQKKYDASSDSSNVKSKQSSKNSLREKNEYEENHDVVHGKQNSATGQDFASDSNAGQNVSFKLDENHKESLIISDVIESTDSTTDELPSTSPGPEEKVDKTKTQHVVMNSEYTPEYALEEGTAGKCNENIEDVGFPEESLPSNHTRPEIISGPEDSVGLEDWDVFTMVDSMETENFEDTNAQDTVPFLCADMLYLLEDVIKKCSVDALNSVLSKVIHPETLIVLCYHPSSDIRTAVIRLLATYLSHASDELRNAFLKLKGFMLLSNQLHQYPASPDLVDACFSIFLNRNFCMDELPSFSSLGHLSPVQQASISLIFAVLPNSTHNTALCHNIVSIILQIAQVNPNILAVLIEKGVLEAVVKTLQNILHSVPRSTDIVDNQEQDLLYNDLQGFFDFVSLAAMSAKGGLHYQVINDLLLLLSILERKEMDRQGSVTLQKLRNFQSSCLQSALVCIHQISSAQRKEMTSKREPSPVLTNERLRHVLMKSVDFIVHSDPIKTVSEYEQSFIRFLMQYMIQAVTTVLKKRHNRNTLWPTLVWGVRDTLRLQLTRLLVDQLSPLQGLDQRLFVVTVIMKEEKPRDLLNMVLHSSSQMEQKFSIYLHELLFRQSSLLSAQDEEMCMQLIKILESCNVVVYKLPTKGEEWSVTGEAKRILPEDGWEKKLVWLQQKKPAEQRLLSKHDALIKSVSESAMAVTRLAVESQNTARKSYLEVIKANHSHKLSARRSWQQLVVQLTHERAVWCFQKLCPSSWQLDFIEGPNRERRRLLRCQLACEKRYLRPAYQHKLDAVSCYEPFSFLHENEDLSLDTATFVDRLHANDKIRYTSRCTIISPSSVTPGEILVGDICLYFVGEEGAQISFQHQRLEPEIVSLTWLFEEVKEVLKRRYELLDIAVEIFLTNGKTFFIAFSSSKDRDELVSHLSTSNMPNLIETNDLTSLTQLWREGSITNFTYLMQLSKLSGRTFNDLMQYPVFPFILSSYDSDTLNLLDSSNYRNFCKPISVQDKKEEQHFINNYNYLKSAQKDGSLDSGLMPVMGPYHYGSHYSNSGIVLHFLVRLPPFSGIFLNYQDGNFDIPDRTFHSIHTSWRLSSSQSRSDMKELIPEFFYLPEFLLNSEGFDLGVRQSGVAVNDVLLPSWCRNDPRLFVLIHRQALESDYVTEHLHQWIDLVFGYKQIGKPAVEAVNLFHPATYFGFDLNSIDDLIQREAVKTMVKTFGQTPRQLFTSPHPTVALSLTPDSAKTSKIQPVMSGVNGLKWGRYVGSPAGEEPSIVWHHNHYPRIGSFVALLTSDVFGLAERCCLILKYSKEKGDSLVNITYVTSVALVTWGHVDGNVHMRLRRDLSPSHLLKGDLADPVCCCASAPDSRLLLVGQQSGTITVYNIEINSTKCQVAVTGKTIHLHGHRGMITAMQICQIFNVIISTSEDGSCILWDLETLSYIRCIATLETAIKHVGVSNTAGDIALVVDADFSGSQLHLFTINGRPVGEVSTSITMCSVCFSSTPEGTAVNVVATGMANGTIRLWSTWNLTEVSVISTDKFTEPYICVTYSADSQHLYAANSDGILVVWERGGKDSSKPPKYHMLV